MFNLQKYFSFREIYKTNLHKFSSVDARSSPIQEARHKPGPWLEGRATLKIVGQPSTKVRRKRDTTISRTSARRRHSHHSRHRHGRSATTTTIAAAAAAASFPSHPDGQQSQAKSVLLADRIGDDEDYREQDYATPTKTTTTDDTPKWLEVAQRYQQPTLADTSVATPMGQSWPIRWQQASGSGNDSPQRLGWHRIVELGGSASSSSGSSSSETLNRPMAFTASTSNIQQQQLVAHLYVDSLSSEDNGLYSCRVDFRKARSRTQETLLRIIGMSHYKIS